MDKKSKKSNFLRNLLATASIASVIVGGSSAAFGVASVSRIDGAHLGTVGEWQQGGARAAPVVGGTIFLGGAHDLGFDNDIGNLGTLNIFGNDGQTVTVTQNNQLVNVISLVNVLTQAAADAANNGAGVVAGAAADAKINFAINGAGTVMEFGAIVGGVGTGDLTALGNITFNDATAKMIISSRDGQHIRGNIAATAAGKGLIEVNTTNLVFDGTIGANVNRIVQLKLNNDTSATLTRNAFFGNIELGDESILTVGNGANLTGDDIKGTAGNNGTLTFAGGSTVITEVGSANALARINIGGIVNFQGKAGLLIPSKIKAQEISLTTGNSKMTLSTQAQGVEGDITTTTGGQGTLHFHGNFAHTVTGNVGVSGRELGLIQFEAGGANIRQITGQVFTRNITSDGGTITFGNNVHVNDATNLETAPTTINIGENRIADLGRVNFNSQPSIINVGGNANGGTLAGTFENTGAIVAGEIHFKGTGVGIFNGTATKLALIDTKGLLKFSGGTNSVTQIKAIAAGGHFEFADKYKLTGNIDGDAAAIGGAAIPNLDFKGDAEIIGNIGSTDIVGNIIIVKGHKLTVNGATIKATNIFDKAGQGTLALITNDNVAITSQISVLGGGTIDATGMTATKNLTIAGNIGTDPANGGHALEKMLLKGQNLALAPGNYANIAGIDFDKKTSTVNFNNANVNYALGNLTGAENVTLNIDRDFTLYNTKTKDKLKETKFLLDNTLTLGKDNDITTGITAYEDNKGTLVFAGDSALRGPIGTTNKKLKAITVRDNVTATTSGPAFVHGDVTLEGEKSVLIIDNNYIVSKFVGGAADGAGTLRFVNKDPVRLETKYKRPITNPATPRVDAIETLELTDGDVQLSAPDGLEFKKIVFTSVAPAAAPATVAPVTTAAVPTNAATVATGVVTPTAPATPTVVTATAPTLFLDRGFSGINVDSNFDTTTGTMPIIQLIAQGDNDIDKVNYVGKDKDHLVNIKLEDKLIVGTKKFFATVTTTDDGKGDVVFSDEADKVYGLGSEKLKLGAVHLSTDVENFGDTYAKEVVVYAGKTYTASGIISGGELRLGDSAATAAVKANNIINVINIINSKAANVTGGATAVFNDGVTLLDDVTSVGADNELNFAGNAVIKGKIGVSGNAFSGMVTFTGAKDRTATLYSDMYVKDVDFGAETLKVAANLTIGGVSHVNETIALDSNQLILKNTGTWGTNTNISTTLTRSGTLGNIALNDAIAVAGNVPITVKITDHASLKDHRSKKYTFISGYNHLAMADGSVNIDKIIGDVETNQAYSEWKLTVEGSDLMLTRICDEVKGVKKDLDGIGDNIDQQNAKMLAEIQGGDAAKYLDDINLIDEAQGGKAKRAASLQRLTNTESAQVTETIGNTVGHVTNIVNSRLFNVTGQSAVVAAGSDDGSTSMGAWVMPYYSQAVQKNKGGSVGYAVKSGGGVFGFDALANENLTIGAAVSIIKSNMKFKGYKAGEKTAIDTLMLSIYGSQQLAKDFFVQAVASFGSSKVKNTDPRIVSVNTNASGLQTAKASYNSMSYGGELLFGYNAKVDDSVLVTPMAGIRYTRFNGEGYKETGTTSQNKDIRQKASNRVEAIVGARVATTVDTSGITVTPEVHAFVSQKLSGKSGKVDARLDGMTSPFTTRPDKGAKTSFNVGVGVSAKAGVMEYGVGYDAHLANKYVGHQGTLKVRVNF
ncbi:MAG: autotransporter outer membrane beta-barrel domain-containing protein [Rickettsia endosymbiont of Pseudomimeciton antennatum]|nr:autotransporter outer membrane beta-barrel domain-containing protein [Rickettsia endosymbiont of Pseudomimeciton antennatum]